MIDTVFEAHTDIGIFFHIRKSTIMIWLVTDIWNVILCPVFSVFLSFRFIKKPLHIQSW